MVRGNDHSPQGTLAGLRQDVDLLKRRLGRFLPGRLSALGQEVTDWNDAVAVGFYWGRPSIPNSPEMSSSSFSGVVYYDGHSSPTRLMQEARVLSTTPSRVATTWRRVFANGVWGAWIVVNDDTLEVDLSGFLIAGYTGQIIGRRIGKHVEIRSNNLTGSVPSSSTAATNFLNALPVEWRPSSNAWGIAVSNAFHTGACLIRTVGTGGITQATGATWTSTRIELNYFTAP